MQAKVLKYAIKDTVGMVVRVGDDTESLLTGDCKVGDFATTSVSKIGMLALSKS